MARNLEQLTRQYSRANAPGKPNGMIPGRNGPGGPGGPRGPRMSGKPKNTAKTVNRMLSYVAKYKFRLVAVVFLMLANTASSLIGSYMLAPIIDKITSVVAPNITLNVSVIQLAADSAISKLSLFTARLMGNSIYAYITAALFILTCVYVFGVTAQYLQARIMLSVSQGAVEKIRNDLFKI